MPINKYFLSALSAFIIWGFFSLALKPLTNYASLDILFFRVFIATAFLLGINLMFRKSVVVEAKKTFNELSKKKQKSAVIMTAVGGLLLVLNWFLFIYAVNHVSLQSASFAYIICPILTTVLAFVLLKEKIDVWQWIAVGLCVISCIILSYGNLQDLIYSVIIALSFGFYLVSQRKNSDFDKFLILTIQMVIASVILLPFYPSFGGALPTEFLFYGLLLIIVILFTIIPLFLNLYALKGLNSSTVGILMYTNPLIHFFLAIFYFKESVSFAQIVSYSLILISILVFNMANFRNLRQNRMKKTV
ncbi:EamA family transporter [Flavobacterium sp.]|uniref:EamA family transporter n=1 Tax=Flavobacterium sp. TaxID=239 RepID=UPI0008C8E131|nr:EamA family transporter [Flavobacterium sp.]OGS62894.1 MAG: permease [Flavobacteria bacterium GWF1_32_7]HBD26009.1 EamA family transporter [Flavobacterium sp.]